MSVVLTMASKEHTTLLLAGLGVVGALDSAHEFFLSIFSGSFWASIRVLRIILRESG